MNKLISVYLLTILLLSNSINVTISTSQIKYIATNEIIITDALGRTITLEDIPARIISLAPSITEELFYLGIQDKLVGADNTSYTDKYYGIKDYLRKHNIVPLGGYWWSTINIEKILELHPDLVLADKGAHKRLLTVFETYNITVVYLNAGSSRSIQDIYMDMNILATIFNKTEELNTFINNVEKQINTYRDKLSPLHGMRIIVIVGIYNGIWIAGKSTYIDDLLARLGLINPVDIVGWKAVSIEKIAEWNPDVLLVASMGISNDTLREAGIYDLGKPVIILSQEATDALSRPGPLIMNAPKYLYNTLKQFIIQENNTEAINSPLTTGSETMNTRTTANTEEGINNYTVIIVAIVMITIGFIAGYQVSRILRRKRV